MLVSLNIYRLMFVPIVAIALVCVYVLKKPGSERTFVRRALPILGLIAMAGAFWQLRVWKADVVVVHAGSAASRAVYLGSPDHYGEPPLDPLAGYGPRDPTWILNESNSTVRIVTIFRDSRTQIAVAPGERGVAPSVEFLGPERAPGSLPAVQLRPVHLGHLVTAEVSSAS